MFRYTKGGTGPSRPMPCWGASTRPLTAVRLRTAEEDGASPQYPPKKLNLFILHCTYLSMYYNEIIAP